MALRNYMQDLVSSQSGGNRDDKENNIVNITIVNDNSSSSLPNDNADDYDATMNIVPSSPMIIASMMNSGSSSLNFDSDMDLMDQEQEDAVDARRFNSNRVMLDGFRKRQRFLRETLSPRTSSPLIQFSPPTAARGTPSSTSSICDSGSGRGNNTLRGRMACLKSNLQQQAKASPPFL